MMLLSLVLLPPLLPCPSGEILAVSLAISSASSDKRLALVEMLLACEAAFAAVAGIRPVSAANLAERFESSATCWEKSAGAAPVSACAATCSICAASCEMRRSSCAIFCVKRESSKTSAATFCTAAFSTPCSLCSWLASSGDTAVVVGSGAMVVLVVGSSVVVAREESVEVGANVVGAAVVDVPGVDGTHCQYQSFCWAHAKAGVQQSDRLVGLPPQLPQSGTQHCAQPKRAAAN
mmetsp:Transcript_45336/g.104821  ORF Transcript_45336/g.104821 Transcript_45336/m.104821 type:complete len:235 (-) Transcript_45336:60-764(-)